MKLYDVLRKVHILAGKAYLYKREADDFQQDDLYIDKSGQYTANKNKGWRIYDGGQWSDLGGEYIDTLRAEITSMISNLTVDTWTDFSGFSVNDDTTITKYLNLDEDTKTFYSTREGLYQFGGSVHFENNTTGNIDVTVLSRLLLNGTDEISCSQAGKTEALNADDEDILPYSGTVYLSEGDTLKLQYFVTDGGIEFYNDSNFQTPVAVTIWFVYLGNNT